MSNLAYFEVPADNLNRAKKFYGELLGWQFTIADNPEIKMEYWMINTGPAEEGTINMGGMYTRMGPISGIITYVKLDNLNDALAKVEKLGGKIVNPKMNVKGVGSMAHIVDTEGNLIALWEAEMP
jgi:predicted enzyme related to lactoylglutathione lyase